MTSQEQRHQAQQQLNELLKQSHYLSSILDAQRIAVAQSFSIIIEALVRHDPTLAEPIGEALNNIEAGTYVSPSVDGERSLLVRSVRAHMQR